MALTSDQLLAKFREDMQDSASTPLWTDSEIYLYIDAAQKEFCRRTFGIADSTTDEVCRLPLAADTEFIGLDPRILKIRGARLETSGRVVEIINYENLISQPIWPFDYGSGRRVILDNSTGPEVYALITDMEQDMVRVFPISSTDQVVLLSVYRLPLVDITGTNQLLEIHEQHHLYLLYWVKHLALLKQDSETFDKNKAIEMAQAFAAYCDRAMSDQARREHKPRLVMYGGL